MCLAEYLCIAITQSPETPHCPICHLPPWQQVRDPKRCLSLRHCPASLRYTLAHSAGVLIAAVIGAGALAMAGDLVPVVDWVRDSFLVYPARAFLAFPLVYHYGGGVRHLIWDSAKYKMQSEKDDVLGVKVCVALCRHATNAWPSFDSFWCPPLGQALPCCRHLCSVLTPLSSAVQWVDQSSYALLGASAAATAALVVYSF